LAVIVKPLIEFQKSNHVDVALAAMENNPLQLSVIPSDADFSELGRWLEPFLKAEGERR